MRFPLRYVHEMFFVFFKDCFSVRVLVIMVVIIMFLLKLNYRSNRDLMRFAAIVCAYGNAKCFNKNQKTYLRVLSSEQ